MSKFLRKNVNDAPQCTDINSTNVDMLFGTHVILEIESRCLFHRRLILIKNILQDYQHRFCIRAYLSIKKECEDNNWFNKKYCKSIEGSERASTRDAIDSLRSIKRRTAHTERLHREAILAFSIEDLSLDLGINLTLLPRHKS